LRNIPSAEPRRLRNTVKAWCDEHEFHFEGLWYEFLEAWPRINCPAGRDPFDVAKANAEGRSLTFPLSAGNAYNLLASFAYYVSGYSTEDGRIQLPTARLGRWLRLPPRTVSKLIS